MKRIQNVSLFLSVIGGFLYGIEGIFQIDLISALSLKLPAAGVIVKVLFAASAMINILLFSDIRNSK